MDDLGRLEQLVTRMRAYTGAGLLDALSESPPDAALPSSPLDTLADAFREVAGHLADLRRSQEALAATIADALATQQAEAARHADGLQAVAAFAADVGRQTAASIVELAGAVRRQNQIALAPRVAVRDRAGNIIASEVRVEPLPPGS